MAAIFRVKLEDDYTARAKSIADSTSQMEKAMAKVGSVAKKTGSALKSSLDRKYQVNIKETGSKYLENRVNGLKKNLGTLDKPYEVKITAKMSRLDKVKANLSEIKTKAVGADSAIGKSFASVKKLKVDYSAFRQAKKEAKQVSKEISAFTGKKHKVKIEMENPVKGFLSNVKSDLKTGLGKLNPMNMFGKGGSISTPTPVADTGGGGGLVGSIIKGNLITGAIQKGLGVIGGATEQIFGAGMQRLENIQASKARLKGFGHDEAAVNKISQNAMKAVEGTAYGFGDAMTASASAVAAGIEPGDDLYKHLKNIGNAAAATGADFNEMGSIFNKVKTTGYLQGDEAMQIMDRGIALLPALAKTMGTSVDEVRKKMSKGEVTFEQFSSAMEDATGTVADEMANTFSGAKANLKSALGRVGANLIGGSDNNGGVFAMLTPMLIGLKNALGPLESVAGKVGDKFAELTNGAIDKLKSGLDYLGNKFKPLGDKLATFIEPLKGVFTSLKDSFGQILGSFGGLGGSLIDTLLSGDVGRLSALADIVGSYVIPVLQTVAQFISASVVPAIQNAVSWIQANVIPAIQQVLSFVNSSIVPVIQTIGSYLIANVMPILQAVGSFITGGLLPALQLMGAAAMSVLVPAFQMIGSFAQSVLIPALSWLGQAIVGTVIPALSSLVSWVIGNLLPVIVQIGSLIASVVIPVVTAIASLIAGAVMGAFSVLVGIVNTVVGIFNSLVSAVGKAVDALSGIGSAIKSAVSGAVGKVTGFFKGGNATGTEYFGGGITRINERGEEMIQLARGDKIFPAGKTNRTIEKEVNKNRTVNNNQSNPNIIINVYESKNGRNTAKEISEEIKRLGVLT